MELRGMLKNISRRSSFITPDKDIEDDESENEITGNHQLIDAKKLARDICREVQKTFREEFCNLESTLEFLSEQLTTMEQAINKQDSKIKDLEHKNQELSNKNKNLELKIDALEQVFKNFEQKSLTNMLEISGLPEISQKDVKKNVETVAVSINVNEKDVQSSQRLPGTKNKPGSILVELKSKISQEQWIESSKKKTITLGQVLQDIPKEEAENRIFIREALIKYQKTLLYEAKSRLLNKVCQYVWCKNGKICARKTGTSKIIYIRNNQDICSIEKEYSTQINRSIANLLKSSKKSTRCPDNIKISDIRIAGQDVASSIADLINCSVKTGLYPDDLQVGSVRPIHKKGKRNAYTNYRPITLLSTIDKIVEKHILIFLSWKQPTRESDD
ncbi:uncharacterized protein LOC121727153 [Aricia agestis]|uniref:uncharacterized protein LOC121727153 n=1 Tax=Aricia agestis TaxID=91739 RepID=UPI001C204410|nr:uncharacterized protein LOC121727153 [Aricia agestis]